MAVLAVLAALAVVLVGTTMLSEALVLVLAMEVPTVEMAEHPAGKARGQQQEHLVPHLELLIQAAEAVAVHQEAIMEADLVVLLAEVQEALDSTDLVDRATNLNILARQLVQQAQPIPEAAEAVEVPMMAHLLTVVTADQVL